MQPTALLALSPTRRVLVKLVLIQFPPSFLPSVGYIHLLSSISFSFLFRSCLCFLELWLVNTNRVLLLLKTLSHRHIPLQRWSRLRLLADIFVVAYIFSFLFFSSLLDLIAARGRYISY